MRNRKALVAVALLAALCSSHSFAEEDKHPAAPHGGKLLDVGE